MAALITSDLHTQHVVTAERHTALSGTGIAEMATSALKIMATFVIHFRTLFTYLLKPSDFFTYRQV
jgi:hypothetical protein